MTLRCATLSSVPQPRFRLPHCPECDDMLLAPMLAQHVSPQLVHNHWVCESCGHTFRKEFSVTAEDDLVDA